MVCLIQNEQHFSVLVLSFYDYTVDQNLIISRDEWVLKFGGGGGETNKKKKHLAELFNLSLLSDLLRVPGC